MIHESSCSKLKRSYPYSSLVILFFFAFPLLFTWNASADEIEINVFPVITTDGYQEGWISLNYWDGSTQTVPYAGYFDSSSNTGEFLSVGTSNFPPVQISYSAVPMQGSGYCDPATGICFSPQSEHDFLSCDEVSDGAELQGGAGGVIAACLINAFALRLSCEFGCGARGVAVNDLGVYCGLPHVCRCNPPPAPPTPPTPPVPPAPPPQIPGSCAGAWMACTPWTSIGPFVIPNQWTVYGN